MTGKKHSSWNNRKSDLNRDVRRQPGFRMFLLLASVLVMVITSAVMSKPAQSVSLWNARKDPAVIFTEKVIPGIRQEDEESEGNTVLKFAVSEDEEFRLEYTLPEEAEEEEIILQETDPADPEYEAKRSALQEEYGKEIISVSFWQLPVKIGGDVTLAYTYDQDHLSGDEEICILHRNETGEYEESETADAPEEDDLRKIVLKTSDLEEFAVVRYISSPENVSETPEEITSEEPETVSEAPGEETTEETEIFEEEEAPEETVTEDTADEETATDTEETEDISSEKHILTRQENTYTVTLSYGDDAMIPDGSTLFAREIIENTGTYQQYLDQAGEQVEEITYARFFDIRILDPSGNTVEPQGKVDVCISSTNEKTPAEAEVRAVHFGAEETEVLETEDNNTEEIRFEAESFSVYGILYTVDLHTECITAEGRTYSITVSYTEDAGLPEDAALDVREITPGKVLYGEYALKAEEILGWQEETPSYMRLFDISIVDGDGRKIEIGAPVDVRIELADKVQEKDTRIVHFTDGTEEAEIIDGIQVEEAETEGLAVSFEAPGFSVYAIVDAPEPAGVRNISSLDELSENTDKEMALSIARNGGEYFTNRLNGNNCLYVDGDVDFADGWYFENSAQENKYYLYTFVSGEKRYLYRTSGNNVGLRTAQGSLFEVSEAGNGKFYIKLDGDNRWLQYSNGGGGIRLYTDKNNAANSQITITDKSTLVIPDDPYGLDGKTYGIAYHDNTVTAAGLMDEEITVSGRPRLRGEDLLMKPDALNHTEMLLVSEDSDLTEWTFTNIGEDRYYITANGKYLTLNSSGATLSDTPGTDAEITVIPGTGEHDGRWHFRSGNYALDLPGNAEQGFAAANTNKNTTWMNLVEKSTLDNDSFNLYTARKVSVSDTVQLKNGQKVVIYTRIWNDTKKRYEFFAVDHDGSLLPCYDTGDNIQWVGTDINTAEWIFTEYTNPDGTVNYYYELQNAQYGNYIAPQHSDEQILSPDTIGINLNGRRNGEPYSTIIAWDDGSYSYSGLKTENGKIAACSLPESEHFYFAIVTESSEEDELSYVKTVDNDDYGITMKMIDFNNTIINNRDSKQTEFFGRDTDVAGLLSSNLDENGYPIRADGTGRNLAELFDEMTSVNHLFIQSIYNESGYFEYDCTQNFAHLNDDGTFTVYDQLGAMSGNNTTHDTRKHGQFMPYEDIEPGVYATYSNGNIVTNQTDVLAHPLPDLDPRKGEKLHDLGHVNQVDYFFGMEMEASFTQTASGLDAWGHDIIFEFSGDDDFWFYVDGELVLDLGGVHSAMVGSINFRTGEIISSRGNTTLYEAFKKNYQDRGMPAAEIDTKLNEIFHQVDGHYVFKDYTNHHMKMFYMERGAGASNLHMRFNLAAVKPGTFQLSKTLSGTDDPENDLVEFPYQIYYRLNGEDEGDEPHLLDSNEKVCYLGTTSHVKFAETFTPAGGKEPYENVFFLKPGQTAEVGMPEDVADYYVVECGVNPDVFDNVIANDDILAGTDTQNMVGETARQDYETSKATLKDRPKLDFDNHVREGAMRTMDITKILYDTDGQTLLHYPDNTTPFTFRLYLGNENSSDDDLPLADMYYYLVKDGSGNYCRWDAAGQKFISIGKTDYDSLSDEEKEQVTFRTSMNGSIAKIPADHTVEVRNLIVGTKFKIEERDYEIPKGYTLRLEDGYTRLDDGDPHTTQTEPLTGTIISDNDPEIEVRNQKGWGLTADKIWTDKDFMEMHDPIYFAVYVKALDSDAMTLLEDTVRELRDPETSVYYFFGNLQSTIPFANYVIREVVVADPVVDENGTVTEYSSLEPIEDGETLTVGGTPAGGEHQDDYLYTVTYQPGEETVHNENVRTDTVTNSRPGIALYKQDMTGHPLADAVFTLKDEDGDNVGAEHYISDTEGKITIAYLSPGVYTLTETTAPAGYVSIDAPMTITISEDDVEVGGISENMYIIDKTPESGMSAEITIKNRPGALQVEKIDGETGEGIANVHFALYRQVIDNTGTPTKDYNPIAGYEDLVTDHNGILEEITFRLRNGTYYLTETQAAENYSRIEEDLCFTIGMDGTVSINDEEHASWLIRETDETTHTVSYRILIPNSEKKHVSVWKTDIDTNTITTGAHFELYRADDFDDEQQKPIEGAEAVITGMTGPNGILPLGPLSFGEYRLVETRAPEGFVLPHSAIKITVSNARVTAMQDDSPSEVVQKGHEHWVVNQHDTTWQINVWNSNGAVLPSTGGTGTGFYYLSGGILMLAAVILLKRQVQKKVM